MSSLVGRTVVAARRQNDDQYHLGELQIALDPGRPEHAMPPFLPSPARILDIGCGAGQTLIAGFPERACFGLDIDRGALELGRTLTSDVRFAQGMAEALPYKTGAFDMVIARVSLPYTFLPASLPEIQRVLKPGGLLWGALHPFRICWRQAMRSNCRGKLLFAYVAANSLLFHWFQRQFVMAGRCESFQTCGGIRKALEKCGLRDIHFDLNAQQFLVTARKALL